MLGITGVDVTAESAQMYDMPQGVYVSEVVEGGGAEAAGLQRGYIITGLEGSTITDMETLQDRLTYYRAGEEVTVTVQVPSGDGYEEQEFTVTLGAAS